MESAVEPTEEHEIKVVPPPGQQVKLLASLRSKSIDELRETLQGFIGASQFSISLEGTKTINDEYYDTTDLQIFEIHALLRVRHVGDTTKLIVKTLTSQSTGELRRAEHEFSISAQELKDLESTNFKKYVDAYFPELSGKAFSKLISVRNDRLNYLLDRDKESYRLSLDQFVLVNSANGRASNQLYEIELEALNADASEQLPSIKQNLLRLIKNSRFSNSSKYERGIRHFYLDQAYWKQALSSWSTGTGLNWLGVILNIIGLVLTALGLYLTSRASP